MSGDSKIRVFKELKSAEQALETNGQESEILLILVDAIGVTYHVNQYIQIKDIAVIVSDYLYSPIVSKHSITSDTTPEIFLHDQPYLIAKEHGLTMKSSLQYGFYHDYDNMLSFINDRLGNEGYAFLGARITMYHDTKEICELLYEIWSFDMEGNARKRCLQFFQLRCDFKEAFDRIERIKAGDSVANLRMEEVRFWPKSLRDEIRMNRNKIKNPNNNSEWKLIEL